MPLVFVSYSRKDKEKVDALRRRLAWRGVRTWVDTRDIVAGEWRTAIKRALRRSSFFLACLSQNTVQRGEVLQYEFDSALEIQRERLEGDVYMIPVRLEACDIPDSLSHLQCLDVNDPGDWKRLIRALRSKSPLRPMLAAEILCVFLLAASGLYLGLRPTAQSALLAARAQGKAAVATNHVQLGVTLWKMERSLNSDPRSIREIVQPQPSGESQTASTEGTPVRLPPGAIFHRGDYFQVGIESSRSGYLYVINRSFRTDGSTGPASLIFPTKRIRGGDNQVWPSDLVRLPDRDSKPPYFEFRSERPDYAGELVIVLLAPHPLEGVSAQADAAALDDATVADWGVRYGKGVSSESYEARQLRLTPEEAAARDLHGQLTRAAPPPEFILEATRAPDAAILGTLKIPVGEKQ